MPLKPGHVLRGQYEILGQLGRVGSGFVYHAHDNVVDKPVAIEEVIPDLLGDEATLERILGEDRATVDLRHDGIVTTHTVFTENDNCYLVTEYLPGGSLEDLLQREAPLPVDDALGIASEVCEALQYAHDRGIVHCALRPANVLFAADGSARLAGFGLAHVSGQAATPSWQEATGHAGGTLPYLAPEQLDGQRDEPRSDLYALGTVLYRMLTGRPYLDFDPRDTPDTRKEYIERIHHEQPLPPSAHNPQIPRWLDELLVKVLAKQPEDRHASAASLQAALLGPESEPGAVRVTSKAEPGEASTDHVASSGPRRLRPPTSARRSDHQTPTEGSPDPVARAGGKARTIPWLAILVLCLLLAFLILVAILVPRLYRGDFAPAPVTSQVEEQVGLLMEQASEAFENGDLDLAEEKYRQVLDILPDHMRAKVCQETIQVERSLRKMYADASAFQQMGELEAALHLYSELEWQRGGYRDVSQRIEECKQGILKEEIFASAEADYAAGLLKRPGPVRVPAATGSGI